VLHLYEWLVLEMFGETKIEKIKNKNIKTQEYNVETSKRRIKNHERCLMTKKNTM